MAVGVLVARSIGSLNAAKAELCYRRGARHVARWLDLHSVRGALTSLVSNLRGSQVDL